MNNTIKYFCFDCETGGLDTQSTLLEIYGKFLDQNLNMVEEVYWLIKPDTGNYWVNAESLVVNKIDLVSHDKNATPQREAAMNFVHLLKKLTLENKIEICTGKKLVPIGHGVKFDILHLRNFIEPYLTEYKFDDFFSRRYIDTSVIAEFLILTKFLPSNFDCKLENLADFFGIKHGEMHNAKTDVEVTIQVIKKMNGLIINECL